MIAYRSQAMWQAALDLAANPRAARLIGQHEHALRALSERRACEAFTLGLYRFAPGWYRVVFCAITAIAARYGWADGVEFGDGSWMRLSNWLGLEHEDDERLDAAWAVRHAHKWKDEHPGTRAVSHASEWDDATLTALATWLDDLTALTTSTEVTR